MTSALATTSMALEYARRYPGEVARALEARPTVEVADVLTDMPPADASAVLRRLTQGVASRCLAHPPADIVAQWLRPLDPARAAALLAACNAELVEKILGHLSKAEADELRELMTYPRNTAGGVMQTTLDTFPPDATVQQILEQLRSRPGRRIPEVFLVHTDGRLAGTVPIEALAVAEPTAVARQFVSPSTLAVDAMTPRDELVEIMMRTGTRVRPVVDAEKRVLGVVQQDQLVRAVEEERSADVQAMVGASREEEALSPVAFAVRKRMPWLQVNLLTAFLAAAVVGLFEGTIAQVTALAVLLPVVAGQSGNTGAQALAVTMRGLALRQIRLRHWRQVSIKETTVGLINGVAVAATTSLGVFLWSQSVALAMVIGSSMIISMVAAGLAGATVPLVLTALKQDPAQSSSIILTTVTDVVGFFSFLGIATIMMSAL